jgi:hypothetical protein
VRPIVTLAATGPSQLDEAAWMRLYVALGVLAGLLSLVFVLQYTGYPFEPYRLQIFTYLLRTQDVAGAALVIFIAVAAAIPALSRPALGLVGSIARNPWPTAIVTFLFLCAAQLCVAKDFALAGDEHLMLMQSKAFAAGRLAAQFPPDLVTWVVPWVYVDRWLFASLGSGIVVPNYWPGYALILAPFDLLGIPWACNALLASGSVLLIGKLASRLTGTPEAAGWAMLLAIASPTFPGMAISYFSMTAHLLLNLAYVWLLLDRTPRKLVLAGSVGSLALILSNPVPHLLFALPWVAWIAWRDGRRSLLALAAGYAPLVLCGGLGWWLWMREIQGRPWFAPYLGDGDPWHRLGNYLWSWQRQFSHVFVEPGESTLAKRLGEQVKLWLWTVPGLPALALAGWHMARKQIAVSLLGLSLVATALGYLVVWFDQGYGWGVRYLHPAFGALPVLGAAAVVLMRDEAARNALRSYAASAALLSLVLATGLRGTQVASFMEEQLSRRPPFEKDLRQLVFVTLNYDYYTQDFVQNDPFLRKPVIFLLSRGRQNDEALLRSRFPGARHVLDAPYGHVWRLD